MNEAGRFCTSSRPRKHFEGDLVHHGANANAERWRLETDVDEVLPKPPSPLIFEKRSFENRGSGRAILRVTRYASCFPRHL